MESIVRNKKYYVKPLNSSKANKMTALYHYSGVGFKKSALNLGVFRNEDKKLVGVLQWGCSFQEGIKLNRYVNEAIDKSEYLELNRFSMADSEGKNSESQAISLGIKWIKQFMPQIRLLVSYAGRKEGNYGYIYQATNWEYLGYFISEGFWFVDGEERHLITLWSRSSKYANKDLGFIDGLCEMYSDVRKTWTKQFIYIMRLDSKLSVASPVLDYPKPSNEFPIKTREHIYKQNDDVFNSYEIKNREFVDYYDEGEEQLFTRQALIRRGEITPRSSEKRKIAVYDEGGRLIDTFMNVKEATNSEYKDTGIRTSLAKDTAYKNRYFRYYEEEPQEQISVVVSCYVDGIGFRFISEAARFIGVSKQALSAAKIRGKNSVNGITIKWGGES